MAKPPEHGLSPCCQKPLEKVGHFRLQALEIVYEEDGVRGTLQNVQRAMLYLRCPACQGKYRREEAAAR